MAKKAEKKGVESNEKALKFQEFLVENDIRVFSTESIDDEYNTVMFRSRLEVHGQMLPMAVIIDTSVFTIIRAQIVTGVNAEKRGIMQDYLNELNSRFKIFKYYLTADGVIYLDICIPFIDETFDGKMVQLMLSILVQQTNEIYEDMMEKVWSRSQKNEKSDEGKK